VSKGLSPASLVVASVPLVALHLLRSLRCLSCVRCVGWKSRSSLELRSG